MTLAVPTFDTEALTQWSDPCYDVVRDPDGYVRLHGSRYDQLRADAVAAAEHIEMLEFALKQRAAA